MKFTLLFFFLLSVIYAQDCTNVTYTGDILNCSTVEGFLAINHSLSDNVDGLISVNAVNGLLYIHRSNALTNLNGLSNLKYADSVVINDNDVLNSIVLPSLASTNNIRFANNKNLSSVNLAKLRSVNGSITIMSMFNPANESAKFVKELKMESLTDISGTFELYNAINLMNTPLLVDINLNSLTNVGGDFSMTSTGPINFNNWKLSKIGGSLLLVNIRGLKSISIDSLTSINASLTLKYNDDVNELKLQNLNVIGGSVTFVANSTFCILPTMLGANLQNCTTKNTCNNSYFDTCRTCNKEYFGLACDKKCNCTSPMLCNSGLTGNGDCTSDGCKQSEIKVGDRCVEKLIIGLGIGGFLLLVAIIVIVIVVVVRNRNAYQKLQ